eukprot:m.15610 g.15610  ORF g.15610 m.15610 type:complete len:390 (-) comp5441_c0_seq2:32-1201(-)
MRVDFITQVLPCAVALRVVLLWYAEWHDVTFRVKYTDIDYEVFTTAAQHFVDGASPYLCSTYRYSPLVAIALSPNIYWYKSFGKLLFVIGDIWTGVLIFKLLRERHLSERLASLSACIWLFNPLTLTVSTRGNFEAVLATIVVGILYCVEKRKPLCAGILMGLGAHLKIFPAMYIAPITLFMDSSYTGKTNNPPAVFTKSRLQFVLSSALSFVTLTWAMYSRFGDEFLDKAYFYHLTRRDHRHNFSPYFLPMYLTYDSGISGVLSLLGLLPQAILLLFVSVYLFKDVALACFVQTLIFVAFNKVCTAQYFIWFLCLFPLTVPYIDLSPWQLCQLGLLWIVTQVFWLGTAYILEFEGINDYLSIWFASLTFFLSNVVIVVAFIANHKKHV